MRHFAGYYSNVAFHYRILPHLLDDFFLREGILGDNHQPRGIHVETVDEADFVEVTSTGCFVFIHLLHETVGNGMVWFALGRVDRNPRLFIDDQDVIVFIDYVNRNIFRWEITGFLRQFHHNFITGSSWNPAGNRLTVYIDQFLEFQLGHKAGREGEMLPHQFLYRFTGLFCSYNMFEFCHGCSVPYYLL